MKLFILLTFFLTTNAFAVNICSFIETSQFEKAMEKRGMEPSKVSRNHKRFTFLEKQMIHLMVTQQDWMKGASREEALENFGDFFNGKMGPNAGEIVYYQEKTVKIAIVHYWPGDTEVGAFYVIKDHAYKLIAVIEDSYIYCK